MGWNNGTSQPNKPAFWQDPRLYQIISLTPLLYGLWLHLTSRSGRLSSRWHCPTHPICQHPLFQPPLL